MFGLAFGLFKLTIVSYENATYFIKPFEMKNTATCSQ